MNTQYQIEQLSLAIEDALASIQALRKVAASDLGGLDGINARLEIGRLYTLVGMLESERRELTMKEAA